MNRALERAAVQCAVNGLPVFPLRPRGKRPLRRGWQATATADPAAVSATWRDHPEANIGVDCTRGGLVVVLDADSARGESALRDLNLPETTTVRTARGFHAYLSGGAPTRTNLWPGLDVRGRGGYVAGAGSVHPSGAHYRWEVPPWEVSPAPAPRSVLELLRTTRAPADIPSGPILEGARNLTLTRLAGRLKRTGLDDGALATALFEHNARRCKPPLGQAEVARIARSAAGWAGPPPWEVDVSGFVADERLDHVARHLLTILCAHARHDGTCWPSMRRLATLSGLHSSSVAAVVRRLEAADRIRVERARSGNRYRVLPLKPSGSSVRPGRTPASQEAAA
jgi:Bifunctional DNA primase/polymerase, N-terminal/Primase C terminal 1 (PriCT-1)/Helix-turn-helix domain